MAREQSFVTRSSTAATVGRVGQTPLARMWVFSSRLLFLRSGDVNNAGGGGMVAYAWYVWDHDHTGPTELHHLPPFEKESK